MKCFGVFAIVALAFVCLHADGAETDVVRVFDTKGKLSKEEMFNILKKANLEKFGFKKTVESAIEIDENGNKRVKKTIHYMVTAKCSKAAYWESVLEERLPADFLSSKLNRKFVREIQSRIKGRGTKYCKIGLEIHVNRCFDSVASDLEKRNIRRGCHDAKWCFICLRAKVVY